ncbi:hypothetical protein DVH24_030335 [Malus domestica]|uniref:Uncharacterized protein n=1 Tax=Malus domestica TaxID=3750 RepID=A0A498K4V3_MALDO|nr:hypothetical protein DVH24_030335 [Malus domestica]
MGFGIAFHFFGIPIPNRKNIYIYIYNFLIIRELFQPLIVLDLICGVDLFLGQMITFHFCIPRSFVSKRSREPPTLTNVVPVLLQLDLSQVLLQLDLSQVLLQAKLCMDENIPEEFTSSHPKRNEVTDYVVVMGVIYSMVKQDYMMQERIVSALNLKSSSGELESYCLMWSLRPFINNEIMDYAWKLIP